MSSPLDQTVDDSTPSRDFTVEKQTLSLQLDLVNRSLSGSTHIRINPRSRDLRYIPLNCRQATIKRVLVAGKVATFVYNDPTSKFKTIPSYGIHQHHFMKKRLEPQLLNPPKEELIIAVPRTVRVQELNPFAVTAHTASLAKSTRASHDFAIPADSPVPPTAIEQSTSYEALIVQIDYDIPDLTDALQFIGLSENDGRFPHVFTRNSLFAGSACCLFPCVDDSRSRCLWEIHIKCARTLNDALISHYPPTQVNGNGTKIRNEEDSKIPFINWLGLTDEEKSLNLTVICSGEMTDDIVDPMDETMKTVSFSCDVPVSPNQIGFAIGPFETVELSEFREIDEDDRLGSKAVPVQAYCLPGRADDVRNTCMPMAKAIDYFTTVFTTFPLESYKMCFLDDLISDTVSTAGLSFCSTRILFPEDVIDTMHNVTRKLIHALASQFAGIHLAAREAGDSWIIIGVAYFMTDLFLKQLTGNNQYRFYQKTAAEKLFELDKERPSLHALGYILHLDQSELDFVALKAALVLFILDRRLTKSSGSAGLARILGRIMLSAKSAEAEASMLSTSVFQRQCEKLGHLKLESFFNQWVFGAGCPHFRVSQRFNKKKLVVEMTIDQYQNNAEKLVQPRDLQADMFMRDVREDSDAIYAGNLPPAFVGPMTIRIHEADGTPYEHIVEIKESSTRVEIPYNTKYKRLKRSRRQKERTATIGTEGSADVQDDVLVYCLGDVLQSEDEFRDWRLTDWPAEEERKMSDESYEWIRMDADFEWICKMEISMPPYMFISQLQQDRDVVAQLESLQYLESQKEAELMSTFLTRTVMDRRYFHGIRTRAAASLTKCAKEERNWVGQYHLERIFQELFCLPNSAMTRSNDFSDRPAYLVQLAIVKAMANIKNKDGYAPTSVKKFFVDKLKFNDNSNNEYSDCYYMATLLSCAAESLTILPEHGVNDIYNVEEDRLISRDAINEIDRHRRIDEWIASFHNIYSTTALDCLLRLHKSNVVQPKLVDFFQYTSAGNSEFVRIEAFKCLSEIGMLKNSAILQYFIYSLSTDPSPYIRENIWQVLGRGLGLVAIGDKFALGQQADKAADTMGGLILEGVEGQTLTEERRAMLARTQTIEGAVAALKIELDNSETVKEALWASVFSPVLSLHERDRLITLCSVLYDVEEKLLVTLRYPHYWSAHHLGDGKMLFKPTNKVRTTPRRPVKWPPRPSLQPIPSTTLKLPKLTTKSSSMSTNGNSITPTPDTAISAPTLSAIPPPDRRILKLKTKFFPKIDGSPTTPQDRQSQPPATPQSGLSFKLNASSIPTINGNASALRTSPAMSPPPLQLPNTDSSLSRRLSTPNSIASTTSSGAKKRKSSTPQSEIKVEDNEPPRKKPILKIRLSNFGSGLGSATSPPPPTDTPPR